VVNRWYQYEHEWIPSLPLYRNLSNPPERLSVQINPHQN
jgi:hypothetical protein